MFAFLLPLLLAPAEAPLHEARARGQVMCTMEYRPVCGLKDGRRRTFSNPCMARAEGARRVTMGACPAR